MLTIRLIQERTAAHYGVSLDEYARANNITKAMEGTR